MQTKMRRTHGVFAARREYIIIVKRDKKKLPGIFARRQEFVETIDYSISDGKSHKQSESKCFVLLFTHECQVKWNLLGDEKWLYYCCGMTTSPKKTIGGSTKKNKKNKSEAKNLLQCVYLLHYSKENVQIRREVRVDTRNLNKWIHIPLQSMAINTSC